MQHESFHGKLDGETIPGYPVAMALHLDPFEEGFLLGVLVGEGHFGGDGLQPQATLRMHVRHEKLFLWIQEKVPGAKLYGPYHHGGRNYYQLMIRGKTLRDELLPLLLQNLAIFDDYIRQRIEEMISRYDLKAPDETDS
jgi:hypothetical protein